MSIRVIITSGILLSLVLFPSLLFAGADNSSKVDLNRADAAELQSLPGIGPATAERIVQYRNENGGFGRIEEIMNVRGIGEKKFERLKDLITVSSPVEPEEGNPQGETQPKPVNPGT